MKRLNTIKVKQSGFSLVEAAVVLAIIGLLIIGLLTPLASQIQQRRVTLTEKQLLEIRDALLGYALTNNGLLPCPASNTPATESLRGKEDTTFCDKEGHLPTKTLGLVDTDVWGNAIRYRVFVNYTREGIVKDGIKFCDFLFFKSKLIAESKLDSTDLSNLSVENRNGTTLVDNTQVVAIIFSIGSNNLADEDNGDGDLIYIKDDYVKNTFDDITLWIPESLVVNHLVKSGICSAS